MTETAHAPSTPGAVTGGVRTLLRLEGLTLFIGMTLLYGLWDGSWWVYAILFLVPDLSFAAYLAGPADRRPRLQRRALLSRAGRADDGWLCHRLAAGALDRDDLARPYRLRPRARLRPEIRQRDSASPISGGSGSQSTTS